MTVLSADVEKEPPPGNNYRHLVVENTYQQVNEHNMNLTNAAIGTTNILCEINRFLEWWDMCSGIIVKSKAIRELAALAKKETFDLVIYEIVGQDFLLGKSH